MHFGFFCKIFLVTLSVICILTREGGRMDSITVRRAPRRGLMKGRGLSQKAIITTKTKTMLGSTLDGHHHSGGRWGHRTERVVEMVYWVGAFLKMIPFEMSNETSTPEGDAGRGGRRVFKKFTKSWQMWVYYVLTGYILTRNIFVVYSSIKMYVNLGTVNLIVAGRLLFCVAIMHASVMKLVLLFSTDEMIIALNHVEQARSSSNKNGDDIDDNEEVDIEMENVKPEVLESIRGIGGGGGGVEEEKKSSWYYTPDGIAGTFILMGNAGGAELCLMAFSILEISQSKVAYIIPIPGFVRFVLDAHHSFSTILVNTTNLCVLMALVLSAKNWLKEFDAALLPPLVHKMVERWNCGGGQDLGGIGGGTRTALTTAARCLEKGQRSHDKMVRWHKLLRQYRRLQVFNVYSNGCTRNHFFPGLVTLMIVAILIFAYLALTSYSTLPLIIYLFFPVVTFFLLGIVTMAGLSQVANIFRQSNKICMNVRRQVAHDFPAGHRGHGLGAVVVYPPPQADALYLKKFLRTVRSFGFYLGSLGPITLETPAEMVNNIFNLLLMMLS